MIDQLLLNQLSGNQNPVNTASKTKSEQNDFMAGGFANILQNRLAFSANSDSGNANSSNSSLNLLNAQTKTNPALFEKPSNLSFKNEPVAKEKKEFGAEKTSKFDSHNEERKIEKEDYRKEKAESRETDKASEAEAQEKLAELKNDPQTGDFWNSLDLETATSLIQALQETPAGELEAIIENPEEFVASLEEMLSDNDVELNLEKLQAILQDSEASEAFAQLAQELINQDQQSMPQVMPENMETLAVNESENESKSVSNREKETDESIEQTAEAKTITEKEAAQQNAGFEAQSEQDTQTDNGEKAKEAKSTQKNQDSVKAEAIEGNQSEQANENSVEEKSLRQEFAESHDTEASIEESSTDQMSEMESDNVDQPSGFKVETANSEIQTTDVAEAVKKRFFSLLQQKDNSKNLNSHVTGKEAVYNSKAETGNKSMFQNQQNGSGFSNNFSDMKGLSQSNAAKGNNPAANLNFAEILEKAELLKTTDGKKILNLELDQKEIGKMEMELTSKDGTVSAKISAEDALVKARLEELAPQIKEQLNEQGINLSEITVDISFKQPDERNKSQMFEGNHKSNRSSKNSIGSDENIIKKNVLPHIRRAALNIQAVDLTV